MSEKIYTLGRRRFVEDGQPRKISGGEFGLHNGRPFMWTRGETDLCYEPLRLLPDEDETRKAKEEAWDECAIKAPAKRFLSRHNALREENPYRAAPPLDPRALAAAKEAFPNLYAGVEAGDANDRRRFDEKVAIIAKHYGEVKP